MDYSARREHFVRKIVDNYLGRCRFVVGGFQPGSRIRTGLSALIWSHLTGSERRLAPDLQPLPATGVDVVDAAVIHQVQRRNPVHQPFYTYLHGLMPDYASAILGGEDHQ